MLNKRWLGRSIAPAIVLAWTSVLPAQRLPSPAAPATTGVVSAEHVFNQGSPSLVKQVNGSTEMYEAAEPKPSSTQMLEDFQFWRPGTPPINAYDYITEQIGYEPCVRFGGWYQGGYHNKNNSLEFNQHKNSYNLHQAWLWAERIADGSEGFDVGGRIDFMYGVDAADTQAFGNEWGHYDFSRNFQHGKYGFAIPQLYAEFAYGDVSVKAGHFFTIIGYEVVPATGNFFYSHAMTMYNSEPFTHTGALATWTASEDITVWAGWTAGWDTGFDQVDGGSNFLGGISLALTDDITFTYATTAGDFGKTRGEGYMQSVVVDVDLTDDWEYVLQSDLMDSNGGDYQIGVNQYLFYSVTDWMKLGTRGEWWRAAMAGHDGPVSIYAVTMGANFMPNGNVTIRPEIKYQWSPAINNAGPAGPTGLYSEMGEFIFGVDAVWVF